MKDWRAVAIRYEKTAASFLVVLCFANVLDCGLSGAILSWYEIANFGFARLRLIRDGR